MADRPGVDIISGGRDPDRPRSVSWRLIAGVTAAVLIAGGVTVHLILGSTSHRHHSKGGKAPSAVTLAAPPMLRGTVLQRGFVPGTLLVLAGDDLRLLTVPEATASPGATPSPSDVLPDIAYGRSPLGPDPAVQQVTSVAGGIVALVTSVGSAGLPDVGYVVFIPASTSGAGAPRVIARANYMAVAPNHRDIWVEQAGPDWGNGPARSPAWLVDETGHRLSAIIRLPGRALIAATVRGLLVQRAFGNSAFVDPVRGPAGRSGIPANALIAGTDADQVAWQAGPCALSCSLHVTDLRGGPSVVIPLPPRTTVDVADTADFDPTGSRLALPLDAVNRHGVATGTYVYVANTGARTLVRAPGGPVPLSALPAVLGAIPAGSTNVVSVRWAAKGSGLWVVATDGLFFQVAYWSGTGPLSVLPAQSGLAYKFAIPGPGPAGQ